MSNLYHRDIYKFDEPVKSYWEATFNTNNKYLNRTSPLFIFSIPLTILTSVVFFS